MLSYTSSVVLLIVLLFIGVFWLLGFPFPKGYKLAGYLIMPIRKLLCRMVERKGCLWTAMIIYIFICFFINIFVVHRWSADAWFEEVWMLIVLWLPAVGFAVLMQYIAKRRRRRYELPKRRKN